MVSLDIPSVVDFESPPAKKDKAELTERVPVNADGWPETYIDGEPPVTTGGAFKL